jgi:hypothetical protein
MSETQRFAETRAGAEQEGHERPKTFASCVAASSSLKASFYPAPVESTSALPFRRDR